MSRVFDKYQGYKSLCRENASFMRFIKKADDSMKNFRTILEEETQFQFCEALNLIYQILKAHLDIKSRKVLYNTKRYSLNLGNWYLNGKILRTDNFHPYKVFEEYDEKDIDRKFNQAIENKNDEEKFLFTAGLLFYRLLTGKFFKNQLKNSIFFDKPTNINESLVSVTSKMMEGNNIKDSLDDIQKLYKEYIFAIFLDNKSIYALHDEIIEYTRKIHIFLQSLTLRDARNHIIINITMGYFVVYLRKIISMPISYQNFNFEIYEMITEQNEENLKYEEFYENYYGMVYLLLNDQRNKPSGCFKKDVLGLLTDLLKEFNFNEVFSLRQLQICGSDYVNFNGIDSKEVNLYKSIFLPWKNYESITNEELIEKLQKLPLLDKKYLKNYN